MSVLIAGMEMPKNCGECLFAKLSPTGESLICNYMLSRVSWEERPFDCPLVQATDVRSVVRGKWINANDGTIVHMKYGEPQDSCKCSICGEWLTASDEYDVKGNFCPNCGADMRDRENEKA